MEVFSKVFYRLFPPSCAACTSCRCAHSLAKSNKSVSAHMKKRIMRQRPGAERTLLDRRCFWELKGVTYSFVGKQFGWSRRRSRVHQLFQLRQMCSRSRYEVGTPRWRICALFPVQSGCRIRRKRSNVSNLAISSNSKCIDYHCDSKI